MSEKSIFEWTQALSVGDQKLDDQHVGIFDATNQLLDIAMERLPLEDVFKVLTVVERYIHDHFSYEELYMDRHGYPGLSEHRRIHKRFTEDFLERRKQIINEGASIESVLAFETYLGSWLTDHVGVEDQKYATFIREQAEKPQQ